MPTSPIPPSLIFFRHFRLVTPSHTKQGSLLEGLVGPHELWGWNLGQPCTRQVHYLLCLWAPFSFFAFVSKPFLPCAYKSHDYATRRHVQPVLLDAALLARQGTPQPTFPHCPIVRVMLFCIVRADGALCGVRLCPLWLRATRGGEIG